MTYRYFLLLFVIFTLFSCKDNLKTPLEISNYKELSSNSDLVSFLNQAQQISDEISIELLGKSAENKDIHLVKIAKKGEFTESKIKVLLVGQQHGNESSGKEGLLLLIKELSLGKQNNVLDNIDLLIIPQANPDGGDQNNRRTAQDYDMNRDHLVRNAIETQYIHQVFNEYKPEVVIDFHEYQSYRQSWLEFGYVRKFDLQFGCITNINVDSQIRRISKEETLPFIHNYVTKQGYSFFEYTIGNIPNGERYRHSTIDIDDIRHSTGIQNTFSFIVEGLNDRDFTIENIERRAKSQCVIALGILEYMSQNSEKISKTVVNARETLFNSDNSDSVAIRMEHFPNGEILDYPLKSIDTGKDTVFKITDYHPVVKPLLKIAKPQGYLVPKKDSNLIAVITRNKIEYSNFDKNSNQLIMEYKIDSTGNETLEGLNVKKAFVSKTETTDINQTDYFYIDLKQLQSLKIVLALEPQSQIGLVNYTDFGYLLNEKKYSILRVEQKTKTVIANNRNESFGNN